MKGTIIALMRNAIMCCIKYGYNPDEVYVEAVKLAYTKGR